jgi:tetratricopeptide (TPR) repeat protein
MESIVTIAPAAELAWLQLAVDNVETARPREALAALSRITPGPDFGDGWPSYWATRIEALHLLGDHEAELETAREGLMRHPDIGILASYELRALAALGRIDEFERTSESHALRTADPSSTLRQAATELAAHGHEQAAKRLLGRMGERYESLLATGDTTVATHAGFARTLYLLDDRREARARYESLLKNFPKCAACFGALGVLSARSGDEIGARKYEKLLSVEPPPFDFGRRLLLRARIAAALGEKGRAAALVNAAFASGLEFDISTHADPDLKDVKPHILYRAFAGVD